MIYYNLTVYLGDFFEICKFDKLDQTKLDEYIDNKRMADQYYSSYYGKTVAEYTGYSGQAYEDFLTKYATKIYKQETVIDAIVNIYSLKLTDEERTLGIHKYAAEIGISAEQFESSYSAATIQTGLLNDKAMKYVINGFTVTK